MIRAMVTIPASSSHVDEDRFKTRIVSPELRQLFGREVELLDEKDVAEHALRLDIIYWPA